ncbi:unnamed protein product [Caenorhabditis sp. 36 PRJEB53466]|nr:unnamed protein product [Caenorhabditis sp. 36 PRJEB53466]
MGRGHLVLLLGLTIGVSTGNDELQERTNKFIKERLVPALRLAEVKNIDFDRVRLCYCSKEFGCNARTTGWVPGFGEDMNLTEPERKLYENTCYTDGDCYQTARPYPEISSFGCMDMKSENDQTDFHDTVARVCSNHSVGAHAAFWICCDSENFCANETIIYVPAPPETFLSGWIPRVIILIFLLVSAIVGVFFLTSTKWKEKWQWYRKFKGKKTDQGSQDLDNIGSDITGDSSQYDPGATMSTSAEGNEFADGLPPNAYQMLMALEDTSGSGGGPSLLHEITIGQQITLMGKVGAGGFGNVSWGYYQYEPVAVKVFKANDENAFMKEVEIFETNMLRHPNVLRYIGNDRIDGGLTTELWLVTEYHSNGSLHDFLEANTLSLQTWFTLIRSTASGLSFLHTPVAGTKNSAKPAIAHRDIKSRNIMVKHDLTCAIGDLGLSVSLNVTTRTMDGQYNPKSGTVRYLAPEILDGTIPDDLFESFLRTDVYAFALVMWEALARVEEPGVTARQAGTTIPYYEWAERDPSDAKMKDIVCTKRLRPPENPVWRKTQHFKEIMNVISTSWNANPTARFTAPQVKVRLEKEYMKMREIKFVAENKLAAPEAPAETPKRLPKGQKEFEMVPMVSLVSRGAKVYDQETVENRNGQFKAKDEINDPLLS